MKIKPSTIVAKSIEMFLVSITSVKSKCGYTGGHNYADLSMDQNLNFSETSIIASKMKILSNF